MNTVCVCTAGRPGGNDNFRYIDGCFNGLSDSVYENNARGNAARFGLSGEYRGRKS
jgi:hypothetical protein